MDSTGRLCARRTAAFRTAIVRPFRRFANHHPRGGGDAGKAGTGRTQAGKGHVRRERRRRIPEPRRFFRTGSPPAPARRPVGAERRRYRQDRKSVVSGTGVSVRRDIGGRRIIKKKNTQTKDQEEKRK